MYREIAHSPHGPIKYSFGWSTTAGFLNNEIINKYKQLCEKNKDNQIKDNSVIYLSPLSSYPLYKLKNYIQENKLNVTKARKWDKVDTIIVDKDFLNDLGKIENKKYTLIPAKEILDNKNKYIGDKNYQYVNNNNFIDVDFFYIHSDNIVKHVKEFGQFKDYPQIEGISVQRYHGMKNICDNVEFITELFENT